MVIKPCASALSSLREEGQWAFHMVGFPSCPVPAASALHLVSRFPPLLLSWQIRDLSSELLVRYFPSTFPEPIILALFQLAQDALGSPRVQEAEAGAVLMKTILQKYELTASLSSRVC